MHSRLNDDKNRRFLKISLTVAVFACMMCFHPRGFYKENIPEINPSFWISEDRNVTRKLVSILDNKIDIYSIYGATAILMIFYIICCLKLATLSASIVKTIENTNNETSLDLVKKLFALFADFEELMAFPIGITALRVILEVFGVLVGLINSENSKISFNFSTIFICLGFVLVCCADFTQGCMISLRKNVLKITLSKTNLFFQANFSRQCIMCMEYEYDAKLTVWKFFILNRSFILNLLAFFASYAIIMIQLKDMKPDSSGDCKKCCCVNVSLNEFNMHKSIFPMVNELNFRE
ncbi:uncharacterized protein TNCT_78541 [Trichonephila clavata]|uniref:Uncharacterized protein n=1 Tax=Trichonephila clavata TaxID=2740835 RepID=A0A8X6LMD9_TRICU|nr:uncharacterized protein TNCT_78541 [Trichonephila clavata]